MCMCECVRARARASVCAYSIYINFLAHKHLYMHAYTTKWAYLGVHSEGRVRMCMRECGCVCLESILLSEEVLLLLNRNLFRD